MLFSIAQPKFNYFPFDRQHFGFTLTIADSQLFNCDEMLDSLNLTSAESIEV